MTLASKMISKAAIPVVVGGIGLLLCHCRDQGDQDREKAAGGESPEVLPSLTFSMLDEARPLDLIEMALEFPDFLQELDGRRVSLVGFMAPFDDLKDMRRCMIVPSYVGCSFCTPPNLSQVVFVSQGGWEDPDGSFPFIEEASHVSGTFRISREDSDHAGQQLGFLYSLENAVITPHAGEALKRASGHGPAKSHQKGGDAQPLPAITTAELVREVGEILDKEPTEPISILPVSPDRFREVVRADLEMRYPQDDGAGRAEALALLGLFPHDAGWIDTILEIQLTRRVASTSASGREIYILDSVPENHPYVRLWLVGEIADALMRQHSPIRRFPPDAEEASGSNDDVRHAEAALRQGLNSVIIYRYARSRGISTSGRPPEELLREHPTPPDVPRELFHWLALPREVGPFFVDFLVGSAGPLDRAEPAFQRPPSTTMEFFRPRWFQDGPLWPLDPVPADFADAIMSKPPTSTNVLGVGGLISLLTQWYSVAESKLIAGQWSGDRWALWEYPGNELVLLLETRWADELSARQFRESIPFHPLQRVIRHEAGSTTVHLLRGSSEEVLEGLDPKFQSAPRQGAP